MIQWFYSNIIIIYFGKYYYLIVNTKNSLYRNYCICNVYNIFMKRGRFTLFFRKNESRPRYHFHKGIYKFNYPYLRNDLVAIDNGLIPIDTCNVEIHVGDQRDLDQGVLISVIIETLENTVGVKQYIEDIATSIKQAYIDYKIVTNKNVEDTVKVIRFIEKEYFPKEAFKLVTFDYERDSNSYNNPKWQSITNEDWIIHNNKLASNTIKN